MVTFCALNYCKIITNRSDIFLLKLKDINYTKDIYHIMFSSMRQCFKVGSRIAYLLRPSIQRMLLPRNVKFGAAGLAGVLAVSQFHSAQCASPLDSILYPLPPFIEDGYIKVNEKHTVYYHVYGNPNGKPVLFVHGGPGGGTDHNMARFFDPSAYKIILVDQRGCGKSKPFADLTDNTTWDSVRDFEKIRMRLGISKWMVFGGSWGSTLGLAYAQTHPNRVTELVLRGIFLLREKEIRWFYQDGGCFIFPEDWAHYENAIPPEERGDYLTAYGKRLRGELGEEAAAAAVGASE